MSFIIVCVSLSVVRSYGFIYEALHVSLDYALYTAMLW